MNQYITIKEFLYYILEVIKNFHIVNAWVLKVVLILIILYFTYLIIDFNIYQKTGKSLHLKILKKIWRV